ncbi:MAG TPA: MATE family efflux transporter [Candidatus Acidoferrales bacterium]|nr:MATE family efflux transporter [Candidatus Acidoferrales bacterium]
MKRSICLALLACAISLPAAALEMQFRGTNQNLEEARSLVGKARYEEALDELATAEQLPGNTNRHLADIYALRASALLGLAGTAAGFFGSRAIFRLMDPGGTVVEDGAAYLRVVLTAAPLLMVSESCQGVMRACGDTRTPLLVDLGAVALNAVLAPVLIYGLGPFPRLGVAGAGWATVCAQLVMLASYAVLALRRHPSFPLARHAGGPPVRVLGLAGVGAPAALIGVLFSVVYVAFVRSASAQGAAAVAVVGVGNRLEAIQFVLAVSLGLAGASVLGQSLGARDPGRARAVLRANQRWALAVSLVLLAVFLAFPRWLLSWFSADPNVWALGVPYLRVLALGLPATAVEIVTAESIMGSGHTRTLSWIYTLVSLVRIPLAFLIPRWTHSGVIGIAWLIAISCTLRAGAILLWARRGSWLRGLDAELQGPRPTGP